MKTWFILDFISTFPLDVIFEEVIGLESKSVAAIGQSTKLFRILKFTKFVKALKLIRAFKLKNLFGNLQDFLHFSNEVNIIFSLLKLGLIITAVAHWCACMWHLIATVDDQTNYSNWISRHNYSDKTWIEKYLGSLYWAVTTIVTVGYGDIIPMTINEKTFCIFTMLIANGVFGYSMSNIGNIFGNLDQISLENKLFNFFLFKTKGII